MGKSPELDRSAQAPGGWLGRIVGGLNALGTIWILVLMLIINSDIIGRAAFSHPIAGVPEIAAFSIVGIVFLQLPHTLRVGSLTRTDVLLGALARSRPRLHTFLIALFDLAGAAIFVIVVTRIGPFFVQTFTDPAHNFLGNPGFFTVPLWPLMLVVLIGIAFTALQFMASALAALRKLASLPSSGSASK